MKFLHSIPLKLVRQDVNYSDQVNVALSLLGKIHGIELLCDGCLTLACSMFTSHCLEARK